MPVGRKNGPLEPTSPIRIWAPALGLRGPEIRLTLPLSSAPGCDDRSVTRSVLIIDDDPDFLGLTVRILVDLGVEDVWTAANATEALETVQEARPDVVLVDVWLPDRHGIDLAYELVELPWRPRVVLTSSDNDAVLALDPRAGRELAFLGKDELEGDTLQRALLDG
jgi:CheY-like chemotaxis protein